VSWRVPLTEIRMSEGDVEAVLDCLRSGWLTMGPRTGELEEAFAAYVGSEHAVAVANGTAALHLALLAAGVGPGDEVIVPALTFVASASAVRYTGAEPVLCDSIGPADLNIDPAAAAASVTPRTKAIMAVHLAGYPAALEELRALCDERGLALIEDCAQAIGAYAGPGRRVGTVGELGCFSMFSKKQLCVGEGGMVTTDDAELAAKVRSLRSHAMTSVTWDRHRGHAASYDVTDIGFNLRLDEPRAALGLSRLARLDEELDLRRRRVLRYRAALASAEGLELPWTDGDVERASHFAFMVLLADRAARDRFRDGLRDRGVQTTWYPALHTLTAFRDGRPVGSLPRAEELGARHCALPLSASLADDDLDWVVESARAVAAA
jgi:dTDP-4-amino-4,6-dideoxygalactose transaminase